MPRVHTHTHKPKTHKTYQRTKQQEALGPALEKVKEELATAKAEDAGEETIQNLTKQIDDITAKREELTGKAAALAAEQKTVIADKAKSEAGWKGIVKELTLDSKGKDFKKVADFDLLKIIAQEWKDFQVNGE